MLGLVLVIFAIYAQVAGFDFINYDDPSYVLRNPQVQTGLSPDTVVWAFTHAVANNWMPVTILSHALDCQLFGLNSGMHHSMNVLFHLCAALLLFAALRRATGESGPSAFVAFLFAAHPLHVESVVWIAERKDVLGACFYFLGLWAYVRYAERPSLRSYLLVVAAFLLGLMSKPMLVTFPFVLLLVDYWPLGRFEWPMILWEKIPLLAMSAAQSAVTYAIQWNTGAVDEMIPVTARLENAIVSYVTYIGGTLWPVRLAAFYPHRTFGAWEVAAALALILVACALATAMRRTRPYIFTGWFWYLGTLVPVIGLVQVGQQSHADRYTYVPMAGLSILVAWSVSELAVKWPQIRIGIAAATAVCCAALATLAYIQTTYWRNTETLFQHALDVTRDNWVAETNLGNYLMMMPGGRPDAVKHFEAALRIKPDCAEASNNLGLCLLDDGLDAAAIPHFEAALRSSRPPPDALVNLGVCLLRVGRDREAMDEFEAAVRVLPDNAAAHLNLGLLLQKLPGREEDAVRQFEMGLRLEPGNAEAHRRLGNLLVGMGRTAEGMAQLKAAGQR